MALLCWASFYLYAPVASSRAQTVDVQLRAVWGGGPARAFVGSIKISDGTLDAVRHLSVQDDAVGSLQRVGQSQLTLLPSAPASFGGVDLRVTGSPDSELEFSLAAPGKAAESIKVKLKQVLLSRESFPIDAQGTRLSIERTLADRLRVRLNDGDTILAPGDPCAVLVEGYQAGLSPGEHRVTVKLLDDASGETLQQLQQDVVVDEAGNFAKTLFREFELPAAEGVYALEINVGRKRLINSFVNNTSLPTRRLEFVVAAPKANQAAATATSTTNTPSLSNSAATTWREVAQIYPAGASWWDSLGKFKVPTVKSLQPLVGQVNPVSRSLGSGEHQRRVVSGAECMVLARGAWHAFPVSVSNPGVPHRLRIKAPADAAQQLVISLQEPSQVSDGPGLRMDSAMVVEPTTATSEPFVTHELVYWPKTTNSFVLIYNSDATQPAAIAEIVLEQAELSSSSAAQSPANALAEPDTLPARFCSLYMDKPLLAENFNAQRRLDAASTRELDSWRAAWQASQRLAQYTRYSGFNTATLTIACQGGAIYPSQVLSPTPKFDSGLFLSDGSVTDVKDSVELVCRHFNQHGLKLILAIDVEGALPELERLTARGREPGSADQQDDQDQAIQAKQELASLVHYQINTEGKVAKRESGSAEALSENQAGAQAANRVGTAKSPILYNPLDSRVQTALEMVVLELVNRYGHHPCFAGVQINLSPRSHFSFAGDSWGYDEATVQRFQQSLGSSLPDSPEQRLSLLTSTLRLNYLNFRAEQLSEYYLRLSKSMRRIQAQAQLVINPAKLIATPPESDKFQHAASGAMHPSDMLLACGIDCLRLAQYEHIVVLRPQTDSPLRSPPARAWSYQIEGDLQLDSLTSGPHSGLIVQQLPTSFRLPEFDKANPLGLANPRTWLFPHSQAAGHAARRQIIHRLYQHDLQHLTAGGWLIPMGQESALRPLVSVLEQLPSQPMKDLTLQGTSASLRVRALAHRGKTYVQLINKASWPENVFLQLRAPSKCLATTLTGQSDLQQPILLPPGEPARLQLAMQPYSLMGIVIDDEQAEILSVTSSSPPELPMAMQQRMAGLQALIDRAGQLNEQQTLGLRGGDFEAWGEDGKPLGWTLSSHPSTTIAKENELPHTGRYCVRLENRSESRATAWIQSDRIAIPTTGRLALEVWVRGSPGPVQPMVRLSLVGRYRDGKRFQRWHEFVSGKPGSSRQAARSESQQLTDDWGRRPLVLLVPDVPSEDLSELSVAIDLMGQGTICVDDVRVYGMFLHPDEQVHLSGQMFVASQQMRQGDYRLADQLLTSFWANFLSTYLPAAPTAAERPVAEARLPQRTPPSGPVWRNPNAPRFNQWQDNLRNRWQR